MTSEANESNAIQPVRSPVPIAKVHIRMGPGLQKLKAVVSDSEILICVTGRKPA